MAEKSYWIIEGLSTEFKTLAEAKAHFSIYTNKEMYYHEYPDNIFHHIGENIVSVVSVYSTLRGIQFNKPCKL